MGAVVELDSLQGYLLIPPGYYKSTFWLLFWGLLSCMKCRYFTPLRSTVALYDHIKQGLSRTKCYAFARCNANDHIPASPPIPRLKSWKRWKIWYPAWFSARCECECKLCQWIHHRIKFIPLCLRVRCSLCLHAVAEQSCPKVSPFLEFVGFGKF